MYLVDISPVAAVSVSGLQKSYGSYEALRGIDFEIAAGEVFGLLGPNGAGKTTTVEILEGYRKRDGGAVAVLGEDPQRAGLEWRERIGIVLQSSSLYPNLTVAESLALFGGYYRAPLDVDRVIALIGLGEKRDARARTLSGGQKRRLDLGLGLIGDPDVLFLDEPTTGFDPAARRAAWDVINGLRELGKTILLTTHYMEEAQVLADRVVVMSGGRVIAEGTPDTLGGGGESIVSYREEGRIVRFTTTTPTQDLAPILTAAAERGEELEGLTVTRPSLEDVYLELTEDRS